MPRLVPKIFGTTWDRDNVIFLQKECVKRIEVSNKRGLIVVKFSTTFKYESLSRGSYAPDQFGL